MKEITIDKCNRISGGLIINPITVGLTRYAANYVAKKIFKHYAKKAAAGAATGAVGGAVTATLENRDN